jgi:hypothetical protein
VPLVVIDDLFALKLFCHLASEVCGFKKSWHDGS